MIKKILASIFAFGSLLAQAQEPLYDYVFFANSRMPGNYFFSEIKNDGTSIVTGSGKRLLVSEKIFHTPGNALKLEFVNGRQNQWQVKITKPEYRGQDHFKQPAFLSLYYYVASTKTTAAALPLVSLVKNDGSFTRPVKLKPIEYNQWVHAKIPLDAFVNPGISDASVFSSIIFSQDNKDGLKHTLFIDDIEFLPPGIAPGIQAQPVIIGATGFAKHIDINWQPVNSAYVKYVQVYRSENGVDYLPVGIQSPAINRFADYVGVTGKKYYYRIAYLNDDYLPSPASSTVSAITRQMNDDELLTMVQEAHFRYYWEGAEKTSGLSKENYPGRDDMIASGASGFGIMALIAGTERKFISRAQSVERFKKIVSFLDKADKFHGAFAHFMDGPSGKVEPFFGKRDNGGDLVETSFLLQGLLAARAYFDGDNEDEKFIRDKISSIWNGVEWNWYKHYPDSKFLYWHWSPDQEWIINHNLIGWNETMVTYLLAIASPSHAVDASMYYTGWANQDSTGQKYRSAWGQTKDGSMYTNGKSYYGIKLDVGVSNGGPLFFTHYSYMGYDPHRISDAYTNYFINNRNIARINHRYCHANPGKYKGYGDSCWGLTACDGPFNYSANEPVLRQDKGIMAPTGAVSSFPYTPAESMKALKNYYYNYGKFLWGEYGFRDAFSLSQNWCSEIYMGLNQAPMVVMIENYRTGLLWKLFMSDRDVQTGLKKLDEETKTRIKNK